MAETLLTTRFWPWVTKKRDPSLRQKRLKEEGEQRKSGSHQLSLEPVKFEMHIRY